MGSFLSSGKVRGPRFLEWGGGPREARSWPSKSWRRELSRERTLVKAAAAGGGGRRPALSGVCSLDNNRLPSSGGRVYAKAPASSFAPTRARKERAVARSGRREAERVRRGAVGMRFLRGLSTGWRLTMTFGAAKAILGSARLGFEGELYRGRQNHRATALYSAGLATRTHDALMRIGGEVPRRRDHSLPRRKGHGMVRFPPPRIVARSSEGSLAAGKETPLQERSGEAEASFEPRRSMSRLNPPGRTARRRPARRRVRRSATGRAATCAPSRRSSSCVRRAARRRCAPQTTWPTRFPSGTSGIARRAGSCRAARAHCPPAPALSRDAWSRFRRATRSSRRSEPRRAGRAGGAKGFPPPASPPFRGRCP